MDNVKGRLVLKVLKTSNGSATAQDIAAGAAIALESKREDVEDWVKAALQSGIEVGYTTKSGLNHYFTSEQKDSDDCGSDGASSGTSSVSDAASSDETSSGDDDHEADSSSASSDSDSSGGNRKRRRRRARHAESSESSSD